MIPWRGARKGELAPSFGSLLPIPSAQVTMHVQQTQDGTHILPWDPLSPLTLYPRGFPGGGNQLKRIFLELRAWALGFSGAPRRPLGDWVTWAMPVSGGTPSTTSADMRKRAHQCQCPTRMDKKETCLFLALPGH